ncbi:hypothetical protein ADK74_21930 [Streptomyces decoyicus]|nr:hypothetical protein ADK74_21930 [Streptomyces decoyicus]
MPHSARLLGLGYGGSAFGQAPQWIVCAEPAFGAGFGPAEACCGTRSDVARTATADAAVMPTERPLAKAAARLADVLES